VARITPKRRARAAHDESELDESDAGLMVYVTEACERQSCFDFVQEARELPRHARNRISSILTEIHCPERAAGHGTAQLAALYAQLLKAVSCSGASRSFADAFILSPNEWSRHHVVPAARAPRFASEDPGERQVVGLL